MLTGNQGATPITKNVRSGAHYGDESGKEVMENWVCPPNCPVRALDEQTADLRSGTLSADCYMKKDRDNDSIFAGNGTFQHAGYGGDAGGASRFFYCAKASRSEREAGLTGEANVVDRTGAAGRGMTGLKCRKCQKWKSSGNPCQCPEPDFEQTDFVRPKILNTHPTVKPIRLMEYLLTLVTPKGGVALDPFCGSGTTLVAAVNLGINCIGIEQDADYVKIAKARVEYAKNNRD
jgi:site-specific DNA-methyltransferase (adenine-specific)